MSCPQYLVIHKTEWERLKKRPSSGKRKTDKDYYIKSLIEQSQNWIKTWPDTVQGHVRQLKKQKEVEHTQLIETIEKFALRKEQKIKTESIKRAKELIFENSCYGRQLLSALLESKTLEERDKQILFKEQMKQKEGIEKENVMIASSLQNACEMESNELKNKLLQKQRDLDIARTNQVLANKQRLKIQKEKEKYLNERIKDELLGRNVLEHEIKVKMNKLNFERELINEFEADRKRKMKLQKQREEEDELLRQVYNKYQETMRNKVKAINNQKYKANTLQTQHVYNMIENKNNEKSKQYVAFIEMAVTNLKNKENHLEKAEIEKKINELNKKKILNEENKKLSELQNRFKSKENTKQVCYKQSFLGNFSSKPLRANDSPLREQLFSKRNLKEDLKKREKEPSPWSGLCSTNEQFAEQARETLKQCRYKHMARKVINDYRKMNCLDAKSLPIYDY